MANLFSKLFIQTHVGLYRLTKGAFGGKMGSNEILLLTSTGRKTGQSRTTPVVFFRDKASFVVVASNGGAASNPAWYHNLMAERKATIEVKGEKIQVKASEATGKERERLWKMITEKADQFGQYQAKTERQIPVMMLKR